MIKSLSRISQTGIFAAAVLATCTLLPQSRVGADPPFVFDTFLYSSNWGLTPLDFGPAYILQMGATVTDSDGVPANIEKVEAIAQSPGQPDYDLRFFDVGAIFVGFYETDSPDYEGATGSWEIKATNLQGETHSALTHTLDEPRQIPLATNIKVSENGTTPTISWDDVTFDDDLNPATPPVPVDFYRVRLLNSFTDQFFRSDPLSTSSFTVPAGVLDSYGPGDGVIFRINAFDLANDEPGTPTENRSNTFTTVFIPFPDGGGDACPDSNIDFNVIIDGCDTDVKNVQLANSCTISDLVAECAEDVANHGKYVKCIANLTNGLKNSGDISGKEKGRIQSCAAKASIP